MFGIVLLGGMVTIDSTCMVTMVVNMGWLVGEFDVSWLVGLCSGEKVGILRAS